MQPSPVDHHDDDGSNSARNGSGCADGEATCQRLWMALDLLLIARQTPDSHSAVGDHVEDAEVEASRQQSPPPVTKAS